MKPTIRPSFILWTLLVLLFVFSSCSAVKRVIKDPQKTQAVVDHYVKNHPFKNDTTTVYKPGRVDSIPVITTLHDSVPYPVPCDSFTAKTKKGTTVRVNKKGELSLDNDSLEVKGTKQVDTLDTQITDRSLLQACSDLTFRQDRELRAREAENKALQKRVTFLMFKLYGLIALVGVALFFLFKAKILGFFGGLFRRKS